MHRTRAQLPVLRLSARQMRVSPPPVVTHTRCVVGCITWPSIHTLLTVRMINILTVSFRILSRNELQVYVMEFLQLCVSHIVIDTQTLVNYDDCNDLHIFLK